MMLPQGKGRGEVSEMKLLVCRMIKILLSRLFVRHQLSSMFTFNTELQEKCRHLKVQITAARIIQV